MGYNEDNMGPDLVKPARLLKARRIVYYVATPTVHGDYTVNPVWDNFTLGPALSFCPNIRSAKREARRLYRHMPRKN